MRRDTGRLRRATSTQLAKASGIDDADAGETWPELDRKRKNKAVQRGLDAIPNDPDARIAKMKDGRTHLAYKAEHAVDLETGAMVAVTVQPGDRGDTASLWTTVAEAGCSVAELAGQSAQADAVGPVETVSEVGVQRVVADKGYTASLRCRIWPNWLRWVCAR